MFLLFAYYIIGEGPRIIKRMPPHGGRTEKDMARFTNVATLSYSGGRTESNTVTGELVEILTATKSALGDTYEARDTLTYVISLVNSGTAALNGMTVTDDLGAYTLDTTTLYPLEYTPDSVRYYINGVLQTAPTVTAGPPLVFGGIGVPAGGNVMLVYEAALTDYAPLGIEATITNTATVTGGGLSSALTADATVAMRPRAALTISKAICPASVTENGELTYTFVIENAGGLAATADDLVVLTDTFDPILENITVTFNGNALTAGTDYNYNTATGTFATLAGRITVPAATYTQGTYGRWSITPGVGELTVTGTV